MELLRREVFAICCRASFTPQFLRAPQNGSAIRIHNSKNWCMNFGTRMLGREVSQAAGMATV